MGVTGLGSFCISRAAELEEAGDVVTSADLSGKHFIVDGDGFIFFVYDHIEAGPEGKFEVLGGEYSQLYEKTQEIVRSFQSKDIRLTFSFDGILEPTKDATCDSRREEQASNFWKIEAELKNYGVFRANKHENCSKPRLGRQCILQALADCGVELHRADGENDETAARLCVEKKADGVLAQDSDFLIFDKIQYVPFSSVKLDDQIQGTIFQPGAVARLLKFEPEMLSLFACVVGNDILSDEDLTKVHQWLVEGVAGIVECKISPKYVGKAANIQRAAAIFAYGDFDVKERLITLITEQTSKPEEEVASLVQFALNKYSLTETAVSSPEVLSVVRDLEHAGVAFPCAASQKILDAFRKYRFGGNWLGVAVGQKSHLRSEILFDTTGTKTRLRKIRAGVYDWVCPGKKVFDREVSGNYPNYKCRDVPVNSGEHDASPAVVSFAPKLLSLWGDDSSEDDRLAALLELLGLAPQDFHKDGKLVCDKEDVLFVCAVLCLLACHNTADLRVAEALIIQYVQLKSGSKGTYNSKEVEDKKAVPAAGGEDGTVVVSAKKKKHIASRDKWVCMDLARAGWCFLDLYRDILDANNLCHEPVPQPSFSRFFSGHLFHSSFEGLVADPSVRETAPELKTGLYAVVEAWCARNPDLVDRFSDSSKWPTGDPQASAAPAKNAKSKNTVSHFALLMGSDEEEEMEELEEPEEEEEEPEEEEETPEPEPQPVQQKGKKKKKDRHADVDLDDLLAGLELDDAKETNSKSESGGKKNKKGKKGKKGKKKK